MKVRSLLWLSLFSIAMGFMEAAVVVYLRAIFYPHGFAFPLVPLEPLIARAEICREAATIAMLLSVGVLSAGTRASRFACFILCFAIWDLSYYFFLRIILGWPSSIFTWDILFLIPVPWVGPVIAPCIISLTMVILAAVILGAERKGRDGTLRANEWVFFITGSLVVIFSFAWDYLRFSQRTTITPGQNMLLELKDYVPVEFNWPLFLAGECLLLLGIALVTYRLNRSYNYD